MNGLTNQNILSRLIGAEKLTGTFADCPSPTPSRKEHVAENVIVNTSWGYFGANGCLDFLRTEFDKENDARSSRPGECVYEKLIAGHYLGEIVRLALIKLHSLGIVFKDSAAFGTSLMPPFPFINGGWECVFVRVQGI